MVTGIHIRSLLRAPVLATAEATRRATIVHWVSLVVAFGALAWMVVAPLLFQDWLLRSAAALLPALGSVMGLSLLRRGRVRMASIFSVTSLWLPTTVLVFVQPQLDSSAWLAYVLSICLAGLLLGGRVAMGVAVLVAITGGLCGYLYEQGVLKILIAAPSTFSRWVTGTLVMVAVSALLLLATKQLRRALEDATESQERLRSIFDAHADGIMIQELDGEILEVNPAACEMFGYERGEMISLYAARLANDEVRKALVAMVKARDRHDAHVEGVGFRKDGGELPIEVDAKTILYNGRPRVLANIRDITLRKTEERARQALERQLQRSQKMEALGRLVGGIAHDFNNYLTVILGHAQLIELELAHGKPPGASVAPIRESAERSAALVRQLLAFSRRQVLQPRIIDLNEIVSHMETMLSRILGDNIHFETRQDPDLWPVRADPVQLEQVLLNLVVNARDAMPGGGSLTIETSNVFLDQEYASFHPEVVPGPHVAIAVTDTGTGMTPEIRESIFEPFFTTKDGDSSGLGLSTVLGIVKQSGGSVFVSSQVSRGSTFKTYLPRSEADVEEGLTLSHTGNGDIMGSETVLLVEDQSMVRGLVRRALEEHGYQVLEAPDGAQGLETAQQYDGPIDLILTDVVMPTMGGVELVERLQESRPGIRALYITGYTDNGALSNGRIGRGQALLQKPFTSQEMLRTLRVVLEGETAAAGLAPQERRDA